MLGMEPAGPTVLLMDNLEVVANTALPSNNLKRKHNVIAFYRVREAVNAGMIKVAYIRTYQNKADVLTKPLCSLLHNKLIHEILFRYEKREESEQPRGRLSKAQIQSKK